MSLAFEWTEDSGVELREPVNWANSPSWPDGNTSSSCLCGSRSKIPTPVLGAAKPSLRSLGLWVSLRSSPLPPAKGLYLVLGRLPPSFFSLKGYSEGLGAGFPTHYLLDLSPLNCQKATAGGPQMCCAKVTWLKVELCVIVLQSDYTFQKES